MMNPDVSSLINLDFKKIKRVNIHPNIINVQLLCKTTILIFHVSIYNNKIAIRMNGENIGKTLCDGKISKL